MSVQIETSVESNVENLSALTVHRLYRNLVSRMLSRGADLLRLNTPKNTGEMAAHVGHHGPVDEGLVITGSVGIPPISVVNRRYQVGTKDLFTPGEQSSANYPLFRDRGTGIFGPAHAPIHSRRAHVMRFEGTEGPLFRAEVKGQPPGHFMLETYEQMRRTLLPIETQIFESHVRRLALEPNPSEL